MTDDMKTVNSFDERGARVVTGSDQEGIGDLAYYSLRSQRYVIVILGLGKFFSVWSWKKYW